MNEPRFCRQLPLVSAPAFMRILKKTITLSSYTTVALLFSACGGGSGDSGGTLVGGGDSDAWKAGVYQPSTKFQNFCEVPRVGASKITGIPFPDKRGTSIQEKNFLRSWSYETYLWFEDLPDINPVNYDTPQVYFDRLVSNKRTESGARKDNFHWYEPTEVEEAWTAGTSFSYGLNIKVTSYSPLSIYVAYIDSNSPAAAKNIKRGAKIVAVDGQSVATATNAKLNEWFYPNQLNSVHEFEILNPGATNTRKVTLESTSLATEAVSLTKAISHNNSKVGYMQFNTFIPDAQDQWVSAINSLKSAGVSDLVLDLRYNGGGYISVAAQVAYMIAGNNTTNKVFYQNVANSKTPQDSPWGFLDTGLYGLHKSLTLPSLHLQRVYVLSTNRTCSASELVVNSLRGIGVSVYLIGDATCGKPYGYQPTPNCGTTYYTIQFKAINAKGFGEYSDGFIPSASDNGLDKIKGCKVVDDLQHELGDPNEALLSAALHLRATGNCPSSAAGRQQKMMAEDNTTGELFIPATRSLLLNR